MGGVIIEVPSYYRSLNTFNSLNGVPLTVLVYIVHLYDCIIQLYLPQIPVLKP